jgi:hypothetical protein
MGVFTMPTASKTTPAKKTAAPAAKRAPSKKTTPARPRKTTPARPPESVGDGMTVRHVKFGDDVYARCQARARREGRGFPEVLRQLAAEYADGQH